MKGLAVTRPIHEVTARCKLPFLLSLCSSRSVLGGDPKTEVYSTGPARDRTLLVLERPAAEVPQLALAVPQPIPEVPQPALEVPQPIPKKPQPLLGAQQPFMAVPQLILAVPQLILELPQPILEVLQPILEVPQLIPKEPQPLLGVQRPFPVVPQLILAVPQSPPAPELALSLFAWSIYVFCIDMRNILLGFSNIFSFLASAACS